VASGSESRPDALAGLLDWGLGLFVIAAPLPFAAVTAAGRLGVEIAALALLALWLWRARSRATTLPPRAACLALGALLALGLLQILPLGERLVGSLSPQALEVRESLRPDPTLAATERDLLEIPAGRLERPATLSLDPAATASALRTGAALVALLLVATTVAAVRGARLLAAALVGSAALQALYGILVLASGHDRIWNVAKQFYVQSATGTFINRNHFAGFVAAAACCGTALVLARARRGGDGGRRRLLAWLGPDGSRTLLLALMTVLALSGLLLSFSRAGIGIGLSAIGVTVLAAAHIRRRWRVALTLSLLAAAAVPLATIGGDRLAERYAQSAADFASPGGRATVWGDTVRMAAAFPACGTGFGTFPAAFPRYRSPEVRLFFSNTHNDALQLAAEGGLTALLLLAPLVWTVGRHAWGALAGRKGRLAVGFAAGLAALLVHSLVDFHFHIPSNAATIAILAGTVMGLPWRRRV